MIHHGYCLEEPPKTTDVPTMLTAYQQARDEVIGASDFPIGDELATACEITARSIVDAIFTMDFVPKYPGELILSGGGIRNQTIVRDIRRALARLGDSADPTTLLSTIRVRSCDELGLPSQAREAVSFALLGAATLDGIPSNVPSATGARRQVVLGSITPRP
jgi:anhydro-N-acetylmuramic acid kinase